MSFSCCKLKANRSELSTRSRHLDPHFIGQAAHIKFLQFVSVVIPIDDADLKVGATYRMLYAMF